MHKYRMLAPAINSCERTSSPAFTGVLISLNRRCGTLFVTFLSLFSRHLAKHQIDDFIRHDDEFLYWLVSDDLYHLRMIEHCLIQRWANQRAW